MPGEVELETAVRSERQLSPAELAFRHNLKQGIRAEEGVAAFARVLTSATAHRQIYVSSLDLLALVAQAEAASREQHNGEAAQAKAAFARPNCRAATKHLATTSK